MSIKLKTLLDNCNLLSSPIL